MANELYLHQLRNQSGGHDFGVVSVDDLTATDLSATDVTIGNDLTMGDAGNIIAGETTGTQICTATSQKLGFYGAAPVVRPGSTPSAVVTTVAVSTTSNIWGFSTSTQANALVSLVNDLRSKLVSLGIIA